MAANTNRAAQRRGETEAALRRVFAELRQNDRWFQEMTEPFAIEQAVYERAALLSRFRALLHSLRCNAAERGA